MSRRKISWSELPPEILADIAGRLEIRSNFLHFRVVCKSWRKSAPFSLFAGKPNILSPILPHEFSVNLFAYQLESVPWYLTMHLSLVATSVYLLQSVANPNLQPWLFTVEEFNPGKFFLRRPLCRSLLQLLPQNFPDNLDLSRFHVTEISKLYNLSFVPSSDAMLDKKNRDSSFFSKVILFVDSDDCESNKNPRIDDCAVLVLHDETGSDGALAKIMFDDDEGGEMLSLCSQNVKKFDDVVNFRGRACAIDRKGRLYREKNGVFGRPLVVTEPVGEGSGGDRKKRLVESCSELYLIYRCPRYARVAFKVYKLNEEKKEWDELVKGIGDDRILIATHDGCFFVLAKDIPSWRGNSLVFRRGVFPAYNCDFRADDEIFGSPERTSFDMAVFHFGSSKFGPIESYSGYSEVLWPPPAWLSSTDLAREESQKDGERQKDLFFEKCSKSSSIKENTFPLELQVDTQAKDLCSPTEIQAKLSVKDVGALSITTEMQIVADPTPAITKSFESGISKTKFQGFDVSSQFLPILKNIWDNHGNILEGNPIRSCDLVAWALESMAKVVILLQNTSGRSLNNSDAEYLCATLFDLQLMQFNVSWLVPDVVKALKLNEGIADREKLEVSSREIEKVTSQITNMKMKFLAEVGGTEQMLDEQRKTVCESLSVLDGLSKSKSTGKELC
ncbi:hypothetical protein BVRB_5g118700 [Beta vulgaris subsp. vulgaris]|nr:hypothetical protein BVRB_5g118700 [Beta vulgaris subsp. vulgaris]